MAPVMRKDLLGGLYIGCLSISQFGVGRVLRNGTSIPIFPFFALKYESNCGEKATSE